MKYLKRTIYIIFILILFLFITSVIILKIENSQLSYLRIENQPSLFTNSYIVQNVNIVPMVTDTILMNKNVLIVDGIIKNISDTISISNEKIIDGKGGYITPGLIDMHIHLWDKFELGLYLANGVTTVRNLLGMPFHLKVKNDINNNELIGPLFYTATPQFSGINDQDIMKKPIKSPDEARKLIIKYKEQGYDYIKTYNLLTKDIFDVVIEQGKISGLPIIAHPSFEVNYEYHFNSDISTVEHTEDIVQQPLNFKLDSTKLLDVIDGYAKSQQSHTPTLTVYYNIVEIYNKGEEVLTTEQAGYINSFINRASGDYNRHMEIKENDSTAIKWFNNQHNFHLEIVRKLHEAGVNIVCGTDAGILNTAAGFSIHQELAFYLQAGMSNYEALKTATVNPTKVYDEYRNFGTIENGKIANLILTSKNPLNDLTVLQEPEWVMIKGRLVDKPLMKKFKQKAYKRRNFLASMIRLVKYIVWEK